MQGSKELQTPDLTMPQGNIWVKLAFLFSIIGPAGVQMSASMGPGTASSCVTAGAIYGYDVLWMVLISGVLGAVVCFLGAKVTAVSGKTAFEFIRDNTNKWFANILLGIILCTWFYLITLQGTMLKHLTSIIVGPNLSSPIFVVTVIIIGYIFTSGNKNVLKLTSLMCTIMAAIFLINAIYVKPSLVDLGRGLIPTIPGSKGLTTFAGIVGGSAPGIIALWYSFSVKDNGWDKPSALQLIAWDQAFFYGILFALFSVGIYLSGAAVLHPAGVQVSSALDAAKALEPVAGSFAKWIFVLGLWAGVFTTIGGMSTIGSYGLNYLFKLGHSLNDSKVKRVIWLGMLLSIIGGLVKLPAMPLLVYGVGMLNLGGPMVLALLLYFTNNKKYMGEYTNGWFLNIFGSIAFLLNAYAVYIQFIR